MSNIQWLTGVINHLVRNRCKIGITNDLIALQTGNWEILNIGSYISKGFRRTSNCFQLSIESIRMVLGTTIEIGPWKSNDVGAPAYTDWGIGPQANLIGFNHQVDIKINISSNVGISPYVDDMFTPPYSKPKEIMSRLESYTLNEIAVREGWLKVWIKIPMNAVLNDGMYASIECDWLEPMIRGSAEYQSLWGALKQYGF